MFAKVLTVFYFFDRLITFLYSIFDIILWRYCSSLSKIIKLSKSNRWLCFLMCWLIWQCLLEFWVFFFMFLDSFFQLPLRLTNIWYLADNAINFVTADDLSVPYCLHQSITNNGELVMKFARVEEVSRFDSNNNNFENVRTSYNSAKQSFPIFWFRLLYLTDGYIVQEESCVDLSHSDTFFLTSFNRTIWKTNTTYRGFSRCVTSSSSESDVCRG